MIQGIFVIYDLKSKTTASNFLLAPSDAIVKRNLLTHVDSLAKTIQQFPGDFAVFQLGTYDDQTMDIKLSEGNKDMCFSLKEILDYAAVNKPE